MGNLEESKDSKESKYSIINVSKKRGILFLTILFIAMIIIAAISKLTVKELCDKTPEDMMKVRNLGRKSLEEVLGKLKELGLSLNTGEE